MLDATSGAEIGAPYVIAPPDGTFLQAAMRAPRPLKIALQQQPLIANTVVDKEVLAVLEQTAKQLQAKYGEDAVVVQLKDTYYNMREKIEPVFEIVEIAKGVLEALDITPIIQPIRGGTDGSQLSYMGLPTPNIFTGGENYHGKYEFVSLDNMVLATHVVIDVIKKFEAQGEV